uniref:PD-(D/E)XK nuclease family protein n=1 Tax=Geosporobacter subterraneus TaxID=390806 RepID=UPI001671DFAF|nr:PD-(D/E)XK nuclease family protein [Geosporobacter subterraneus]
MKQEIILSVRNLVEFVLRGGDLDSRFMGSSRAVEGTMAHQKLQRSYGENYTPEVALKYTLQYQELVLTLQGRADGIFREENGVVIDEIKTTMRPLEEIEEGNLLHWAQAKCYGYIYGVQNQLEEISLQLTYYHLDSEEVKRLRKTFSLNFDYIFRPFFFRILFYRGPDSIGKRRQYLRVSDCYTPAYLGISCFKDDLPDGFSCIGRNHHRPILKGKSCKLLPPVGGDCAYFFPVYTDWVCGSS